MLFFRCLVLPMKCPLKREPQPCWACDFLCWLQRMGISMGSRGRALPLKPTSCSGDKGMCQPTQRSCIQFCGSKRIREIPVRRKRRRNRKNFGALRRQFEITQNNVRGSDVDSIIIKAWWPTKFGQQSGKILRCFAYEKMQASRRLSAFLGLFHVKTK